MSAYSPSINQDARTHAEHECEIRYLKRLVERKLKEMMFSEEKASPVCQPSAAGRRTPDQLRVG
jgi:hypothetical protein